MVRGYVGKMGKGTPFLVKEFGRAGDKVGAKEGEDGPECQNYVDEHLV